jgi:hypothetical protein
LAPFRSAQVEEGREDEARALIDTFRGLQAGALAG